LKKGITFIGQNTSKKMILFFEGSKMGPFLDIPVSEMKWRFSHLFPIMRRLKHLTGFSGFKHSRKH